MPSPPLELPILQNWSCHNCGGCCRQHAIYITAEERRRIEGQNWAPADGLPAGVPLFVEERAWTGPGRMRLTQLTDGACIFLNEQGLCRIHAKFGEAAKPLACRIYPYAFHPADQKLAVSLRFSCPSVAANRGRSVESQRKELRALAELVLPDAYQGAPPPKLTPRVALDWPDTLRVVRQLDETLAAADSTTAVKVLRCLFWLQLLSESRLEKIRGERLDELLDLLAEATVQEIPEIPQDLAPPSSLGKMQFRLLAGQYARHDTASTIDATWRGRWRQLQHALRLAQGTGLTPPLHVDLPAVPFSALDASFGGMPEEADELLSRYLRVKVQGLHFCGAGCYGAPVIEGFQSLALVIPVVLWLARWKATAQARTALTPDDVLAALTIADHQHGYSEAFAGWGARSRVRNLAAGGEIQKLIGWLA